MAGNQSESEKFECCCKNCNWLKGHAANCFC
jgi:hypothetical protein